MSECVYVHVYMSVSVRESVYLATMEVKQTWVVLCWLHSPESCVSSTQGTEREGRGEEQGGEGRGTGRGGEGRGTGREENKEGGEGR